MSNAPLVTAATGTQQARAAANNLRGVSTLLYACQQGDVEKVRRILRAQPNAHLERDRTGKTALHYCCTSDHISAAQAADVLVMAAPDLVETRDEDGFTPLHLAVIAGNMPLVTFLLANNADVNAVDNEKHTVVHWATVCGETVALRAVLAAGAPVSTPDVHGGYPLHYAAQMCGGEKDSTLGLQVLHTLLSQQDISVSVEDGDGRQPLLWAASAGSAKAVLALIRAGATVESHDKDGLTALHCAASRGHTDCIDTLLTLCGASPDVIDSNGCTALHYAVTLGHADATALLLAHAADPNRQDRKGRSPSHCGCAKGQFETVKMLGSQGANLWLRNARGDLPLHEAAASGRRDLVKWLLEARPSQVNARNNDGRCPLHLAALNDNADMCKILLDTGAQINPILRTSKNIFMTPLDCALQRGFRSTAKYLQLHGGIPANRLAGVSQQPQAFGSAVSLQIRDDVTLYGGSSSESEKEEAGKSKSKKKSYKRKLAYKYERKKGPLSMSEYDSEKLTSGKLESEPISKGKDNGKRQDIPGDQKDGMTPQVFPFLGSNIPPGEIFIYANEVNINDKFGGVNIKQNGEVIVGDASKISNSQVQSTAVTTQPASSVKGSASSVSEKQDRRPKSAKYGRLKSKSGRQNEKDNSARKKTYVDTPDPRRKQPDEEFFSNNIDEEVEVEEVKLKKESTLNRKSESQQRPKDETVVVSKPEQSVAKAVSGKTEVSSSQEKHRIAYSAQQSARSNTSYEDGEDHKELVVEASVHLPPREANKGVEVSKQALEISESSQERRRTPIGSEILSGDELRKIEVINDQNTYTEEDKEKLVEHVQATQKPSVLESDTVQAKIEIPTAVAETTTSIVGTAAAIAQAAATKETERSVDAKEDKVNDAAPTDTKSQTEKDDAAATKVEIIPKSVSISETDGAAITESHKSDLTTETTKDANGTTINVNAIPHIEESSKATENEDSKALSTRETVTVSATSVTDTSEAENLNATADSSGGVINIPRIETTNEAISDTTLIDEAAKDNLTESQDKSETDLLTPRAQAAKIAINIEGASSPSPTPTTDQDTTSVETPIKTVQNVDKKENIEIIDTASLQRSGEEVDYISADLSDNQDINRANNISMKETAKAMDGTKVHKKQKFRKHLESETSSDTVEQQRKTLQDDGIAKITENKKLNEKSAVAHKKRKKVKESSEKATKVAEVASKKIEGPPDSSMDVNTSEESESESPSTPSSTASVTRKEHRSFKVLDENEDATQKVRKKSARQKSTSKKQRSKSEENKVVKMSEQRGSKEHERLRRSKIPTPVMNLKTPLSKSDKHLDRHAFSGVEARVPSLPEIHDSKDGKLRQSRSVSNLSAPLVGSTYSDNDHETGSEEDISSATRRKRLRKRSKTRSSKSAGSDYESSNLIDSGFEPSPRSSRIPKWKNMTERGVNMTSVTQTIQTNIRRYHLERKIFQHLLDLKRLQIRSGQHNEAVLVKRAIDAYHRSCAATVGAGRYTSQDYSFRSFEYFLYNSLRKIQRNGIEHLQGLPEAPRNPLLCTQRTHRCDHATHAYTGVPCAAYLPKMDHHTIPKIGFECKPSGFLPNIHPKKNNTVTLELCHGNDKQVISLPAERLDQNKRYYVTFTVKGGENNSTSTPNDEPTVGHRHSKSD